MVGRCLQVESDVLRLKLRLIVVVGITGMTYPYCDSHVVRMVIYHVGI